MKRIIIFVLLLISQKGFSQFSEAPKAGEFIVSEAEKGAILIWRKLTGEEAAEIFSKYKIDPESLKDGRVIEVHDGIRNLSIKADFGIGGLEKLKADEAKSFKPTPMTLVNPGPDLYTFQHYARKANYLKVRYIKHTKEILNFYGYNLPENDKLGPQTIAAIKNAFGFDCRSMPDWCIYRVVSDIYLTRLTDESSQFHVTVKDQTGKLQEYGELNRDQLKVKLKEIKEKERIKCGLDEACTNLNENNRSFSFACEDANGGKVSITISSKGKMEVALKYSILTVGVDLGELLK